MPELCRGEAEEAVVQHFVCAGSPGDVGLRNVFGGGVNDRVTFKV